MQGDVGATRRLTGRQQMTHSSHTDEAPAMTRSYRTPRHTCPQHKSPAPHEPRTCSNFDLGSGRDDQLGADFGSGRGDQLGAADARSPATTAASHPAASSTMQRPFFVIPRPGPEGPLHVAGEGSGEGGGAANAKEVLRAPFCGLTAGASGMCVAKLSSLAGV